MLFIHGKHEANKPIPTNKTTNLKKIHVAAFLTP